MITAIFFFGSNFIPVKKFDYGDGLFFQVSPRNPSCPSCILQTSGDHSISIPSFPLFSFPFPSLPSHSG